MDTDGGEVDRQAAGKENAALDGVDELWYVGVAWVERRVRVDDTDDGRLECRVRVAQGFDEDFAEEEREVRIAVRGQTLAKSRGRGNGLAQVVVGRDPRV